MSALGRSALVFSSFIIAVLLVFTFAAIFVPRPSQASCKCRCVDGEAMAVCSTKRQLRNTQLECANLACPPVDARRRSSSNTRRCTKRRVFNPRTGVSRWRRICVHPPDKPKPECKNVDFLNPSTGLYDSKTVCPGNP